MRTAALFLTAAMLAGCSGIPSEPYVEPTRQEGTARVRVITNSSVFGDSINGSCAPVLRHKMAEAGRFSEEGHPNINHPQFPLKPTSLGMPERVAPKLVQYVGAVRMGEGLYTEIVTEYRVRADLPFQVATLGAAVGSLGSTYSTCPAQAKVFQLESGQDYELFVGVGIRGEQLVCGFGMYHLMTFGKSPMVVPFPLDATEAPQALCKN
ncbi:hypothetical protein HNP29_001128 [Pseudomonas alcaligenes]|uniref:hypothetical protein n=1 Tax=Pseudomonas sp. zfem005 TaxID=3078200 RepID=UPI0017D0A6A0|nr:hypothetical protein [Pseudomonas sp. zfem005]MBB4817771.1 hypothetical protein [Pseudomonas alcaligenes]MDU9415823.1 hypothetical protein [Pseudomonas sp. zfem005]